MEVRATSASPELSILQHLTEQGATIHIFVTTILLAAVTIWWYLLTFDRNDKRIPGSSGLPLLNDDLVRFANEKPSHSDSLLVKLARTRRETLGNVYRNRFLYPIVTIHGVANIKRLMSAEHELVKANYPWTFKRLLGEDTIMFHGPQKHKVIRRMLNPFFSQAAIRSYLPHIQTLMEARMEAWVNAPGGRMLAQNEGNQLAFEVFAKLVLGIDKVQMEEWLEGHNLVATWQEYDDGILSLPINLPGTNFHRALKAKARLLRAVDAAIDHQKARLGTTAGPGPNDQHVGGIKNLLEVAMEAVDDNGEPLTPQYLQDLCVSLMFAGHATTAAAMIRMLFDLARHPEVLEKLREEQRKVVAAHGTAITDAAVKDMEYTGRVIRESLRTTVVAGNSLKVALKDFEVEGYKIKKGTEIFLQLADTMRYHPLWREEKGALHPDTFNPDRWGNPEAMKELAFFPFAHGPRMCLGYPLAWAEFQVFLAVLARGYEWTLEDPNEKWLYFVLPHPANGLPIYFKRL